MANGFGDAFFGIEPFGDAFDLAPVTTVMAPDDDDAVYDAGDDSRDTYGADAPESEAA